MLDTRSRSRTFTSLGATAALFLVVGCGSSDGAAADGGAGTGVDGGGGADAAAGDAGDAAVGEPDSGTAPNLNGDGIAWSWSGMSYLADKNGGGSYAEVAVSYGADSAGNEHHFSLEKVPNMTGTFDCFKTSGFSIAWIEKITGKVPPVRSYGQADGLPCSLTVTKATGTAAPGSVLEGTFSVDLKFAGIPGLYPEEIRKGIVGRFRVTKQ